MLTVQGSTFGRYICPVSYTHLTILSRIFTGQNVTYTVTNKSIIIQNRKQPTENTPATPKPRPIAGKVINGTDKEPLIGVTFLNPESGKGVITNVNGAYSIEAISGQPLKFSYVGFSDVSIKVGNSNVLKITMTENSTILNEVVVVGFGSQKKVNLTGAVGVIGNEEINGRPVASAAQALQGLDPSLNIGINTGRADSGYEIDIRGAASLNGGTCLLYTSLYCFRKDYRYNTGMCKRKCCYIRLFHIQYT